VLFTVIHLIGHIGSSRGNDMQYYIEINIIQFKLLAILTECHISLRYASDFPIVPYHPPSPTRSLSKSDPTDGFVFSCGRTNPDGLP